MTCSTSAVAVCCSNASRVLGDQPRIVYRDDRLRREVLQQNNLLLGEWPHFLPECSDGSEHSIIFPKRHHHKCADPANLIEVQNFRWQLAVAVVAAHIDDVDDPDLAIHKPRHRAFGGRPYRS